MPTWFVQRRTVEVARSEAREGVGPGLGEHKAKTGLRGGIEQSSSTCSSLRTSPAHVASDFELTYCRYHSPIRDTSAQTIPSPLGRFS